MTEDEQNSHLRCLELWDNMPKDLEAALEIAFGLKEGDRQAATAFVTEKYPDFNPFTPRWLELP